ncbi:MAG: acetate--CoA ligase family protein [Candidatus Nanopelagicales bacterium]
MTWPQALADPQSVAVVGASDDPSSWGHWLARGALGGAHRRHVHLVNERVAATAGRVLGRPALARVGDAGPVDLVAVAVPGPAVRAVVQEGLTAGARAFVVITADVGDGTDPGARAAAEADLAALVAAANAVLLGPNCLGLVDHAVDLSLAWGEIPPGDIAVVSQSGQVGLEVAGLLAAHGRGVARFVSVGPRGLGVVDALLGLVGHADTRSVCVYAEDLGDARDLVAVAAELAAAGVGMTLLAPGTSVAGARAAASHTQALAAGDAVIDAVCRAAGMVRADTPATLVAAALGQAAPVRRRGTRVAVVSDSGGQGVLAADALAARGLAVPPLSVATAEALVRVLPSPRAVTDNPVDLAGSGEADLTTYAQAVRVLADSGEVDAVLLTGYLGRYALDVAGLAEQEAAVARDLAAAAADRGVALAVHTMAPTDSGTGALQAWRHAGTPVVGRVEDAVAALAAGAPPRPDPPVPDRAAGASPVGAGVTVATTRRPAGASSGYAQARAALAARGVSFPDAQVLAAGPDLPARAGRAARDLGGPVAVKATSLAHKSDHGGVLLGLTDPAEVTRAVAELVARLGPIEVTVERMTTLAGTVELVVGAHRDPHAGPVLLLGAGGVHAEAVPDTAVALAPVTAEQADALLDRLRLAPILAGWRGASPVDRAAVVACARAVVDVLLADPALEAVEVNPLLAGPGGAVALDAWCAWRPGVGNGPDEEGM